LTGASLAKRRHPMNDNYGFVEFYANEKVAKLQAEASRQRGLSKNKPEFSKLVYIISFAIAVAAAYLVI
jgi:hypothetical protein